MRRSILILFSLICLILAVGVGNVYTQTEEEAEVSEKYAEARKILVPLAETLEAFVTDITKAEDAKAVAEVLNKLSEAIKELAPKLKEQVEKYPELKNEATHPEELKPLFKRIEKGFKEMIMAFAKVNEYKDDPLVQEALKKYGEVMATFK
jgi:predicted ribosome quality control (RQC) complex YloA/Tae2 family protein